MEESYLAKVARALQSGRRFSDSAPSYLDEMTNKIDTMSYNNTTDRQREEQRKIEVYLKVYGDDPRFVEGLIEKYLINQLPQTHQVKAWY